MGASKKPRGRLTGKEAVNIPVQRVIRDIPPRRPKGDIGIGGGPGIPPRFPPRDGSLPKDIVYRDGEGPMKPAPLKRDIIYRDGEGPLRPAPRRKKRRGGGRFAGRRRMPPASSPLMFDPADTLGPSPEREVPLPPEYRERITRESDPRGPAPFMPRDERKRDRFFEERADRRAERRSDRKDRREEFMNEINVGREQRAMQREEKRDIARSRKEERRMRRDENKGRRGNRRNFRRRRSRMERRRSRRERAAFRDRFVSTLRR